MEKVYLRCIILAHSMKNPRWDNAQRLLNPAVGKIRENASEL
jgi:hypothetical protein